MNTRNTRRPDWRLLVVAVAAIEEPQAERLERSAFAKFPKNMVIMPE